MARELNVRGLMNVQFAVKGDDVYVLEVNPRASRTVPFVSKAIGVPLAKLAAKVMTGKTLRELGFTKEIVPKHFSVKEAVFPFLRYQGLDISLGPEMKSTGEVMGIDADLGLAYAKSQMAAPPPLPKGGNVFISVKDDDKEASFRWRKSSSSSVSRSSRPAERRHAAKRGPGHQGLQTSRRTSQRARSRHQRRHQFHYQYAERKNSARRRVVIRNASLAENSDHDHGARGAGERERNSLAPKKQGAGEQPAGIPREREPKPVTSRRFTSVIPNEAMIAKRTLLPHSCLIDDLCVILFPRLRDQDTPRSLSR